MEIQESEKETTFAYLSILDKDLNPGVYKKILATVKGAEKNGLKTSVWCEPYSPDFLKKMSDRIIHSEEKVLMIRSLCQYNFFLIYAFFVARMKGKKIILDVPTPNRVSIHEIAKADQSKFWKIKSLIYLIFSGPVPYWFVSEIIQYSNEGIWFMLGNKSKTKVLGNGIDIDQIPFRTEAPIWPSRRLNLIGVASINYWHGFDRLFHALAEFNIQVKKDYEIYFTVVGNGLVLQDLKKLAIQLKIEKFIEFTGPLYGQDLYQKYNFSHLAIGSLALYRKNLYVASELKAREYCAIGIPFLATGKDPDFPENLSFRVELENNNETKSLVDFFKNFDTFYANLNFREIRAYAEDNLDYSAKFKLIIQGINGVK